MSPAPSSEGPRGLQGTPKAEQPCGRGPKVTLSLPATLSELLRNPIEPGVGTTLAPEEDLLWEGWGLQGGPQLVPPNQQGVRGLTCNQNQSCLKVLFLGERKLFLF